MHVSSAAVIDGYADGATPTALSDGGFLTGDLGALRRPRAPDAVGPRLVVRQRRRPESAARRSRARAAAMPGVADVRVVGVADHRRGEQLVAVASIARRAAVAARAAAVLRRAAGGAQDPARVRVSRSDPADGARQNRSTRARRTGRADGSLESRYAIVRAST